MLWQDETGSQVAPVVAEAAGGEQYEAYWTGKIKMQSLRIEELTSGLGFTSGKSFAFKVGASTGKCQPLPQTERSLSHPIEQSSFVPDVGGQRGPYLSRVSTSSDVQGELRCSGTGSYAISVPEIPSLTLIIRE